MQMLAYPRVSSAGKNLTKLVNDSVETKCGLARECRILGAAHKHEFTFL